MIVEKEKTDLQIVGLCIGFLGLQIGFALQASNITRILHNYGANLDQIALFWLIAPATGALIQPVIGHLSDQWVKKGETRIPLLLFGGVLSTLTLLALPNAQLFITILSPLLFSAIFIFLTDVAFNTTLHPLRSTITDYLPASQQNKGFTIQTFLISIGAIIGSSLPYLLQQMTHKSTSSQVIVAENVKQAFYVGALIMIITTLMNSWSILKQKKQVKTTKNLLQQIKVNNTSLWHTLFHLPNKVWKIASIQFFSWTAFFLLWVYTTPALVQQYYQQRSYDTQSLANEEAGNLTGVLFAYYHLSAGLFALLLPTLFLKWKVLTIHGTALILGFIGFIWIYNANNIDSLHLPMLLIGVAWSSILASPFILLSQVTPKKQVGLYFGLFNIFITLPQILTGALSGYIMRFVFNNQAILAIALAGGCLLIAGLLSFYFTSSFTPLKTNNESST